MLARYLFQWAAQRASSTAWITPTGTAVSWATLASAVAETARRLSAAQVAAEARVVVQLPNGWEAACVALALDHLGAVESPLDHRLEPTEVSVRAARLEASLVITDGARWVPPVAECRPLSAAQATSMQREGQARCHSERPRLILWTSGSTGASKGVVLSGRALEANAWGKLRAAPQTHADTRLTVLPLAHAYARTCDFGTWLVSGGTLAAVDGWAGLVAAAPRVRPTVMNCVPYLIDKLCAEEAADGEILSEAARRRLGIERLRMLGCGGAAMTPSRFEQLRAAGIVVIQGYGLTEAGPVVCSATPADAHPGTVGCPIERTELRVDDAGQVLCRGPGLMTGYWRDPAATAERLQDGWLRTGDRGELDAEGRLRVLGRVDNVIVLSTGRKVSPEPIEQRLQGVPGVRHVVLRGWGWGLEAWVDPEPNATAEGLLDRFSEVLRQDPAEHQVRRVSLLPQAFSADRGALTVKGTLRRQVVLDAIPK